MRKWLNVFSKLKRMLKSNKGGSGIITGILFAAILTIALLGTQPTVISTFTSIASKASTYFEKKADDTFK